MSLDGRRVGVLGVVFFLGLATMPSSEAAGQDRVRPNADPGGSSDALAVGQVLVDSLDFASPEPGLGGKMGLDATTKVPPETSRDWGTKIRMSDEMIETVTRKWADYGLPGNGKAIWK